MRNFQRSGISLFTLAVVGLVGCGGDEAPAPTVIVPEAGADASASPRSESSATSQAAQVEGDPFVIGPAPPNFEVAGARTVANVADVFIAEIPQAGSSSADFGIVAIGRDPNAPPAGSANPELEPIPGFSVVADSGYTPDGLPWRIRCEKDSSIMALVPAGEFLQGHDGGTKAAAPQHPILLDAYYMDIHEITVAQYRTFREEIRSTEKRLVDEPTNATNPDHFPALGINWGTVVDYARWANKRIPTEAEWEKAARGRYGFEYPWGNGRALWDRERSPGQIDPVGSFHTDVSPYGIFDMAGNAREWCTDWYADDAYDEAVKLGLDRIRNWEGPRQRSEGSLRVVKGAVDSWQVWQRAGMSMSERNSTVGFRCIVRVRQAPRRR